MCFNIEQKVYLIELEKQCGNSHTQKPHTTIDQAFGSLCSNFENWRTDIFNIY